MKTKKKGLSKVFNRDPPDWQNQKLILARKLVQQQKTIIGQNEKIIGLLNDIKSEIYHVGDEK